jgi:hypothetical protein
MGDSHDGQTARGGQSCQRGEDGTNLGIRVAVDSTEVGAYRIDDDERGVRGSVDGHLELREVTGEIEGALLSRLLDSEEEFDSMGVGPGGVEARAERVDGIVFGAEQDDGSWL